MIFTGLVSDQLALSRLINFCAISDSRDLGYGTRILYSAHNPNSFSWNIVMRGFSESDRPREALVVYRQMLRSGGSRPCNYTYPLLLKLCSNSGLINMGRQVLAHAVKLGFDRNIFVHNASIQLLVLCGELEPAHRLFDKSSVRDLVSWNILINGYIKSGRTEDALKLYREMEDQGVNPDEVTMIAMVASCAQLKNLNQGRKFHQFVQENRLTLTVTLANALMDMYVKCGKVELAQKIFDDMANRTTVSWSTMIGGYANCGDLDEAHRLFDEMPEKDAVPWNVLIGGYVQANRSKEALSLFNEMQATNVKPDEMTMVNCLSACSQIGALDVGIWIHQYIEKHELSINVALGTALVDMYAKCGNIKRALQVFWDMTTRNSMTWTAIIYGLAHHGHAQDAISFFLQMLETGLKPDEVTFLGVLAACCHGGLVEEGRKFFSEMTTVFNLSPRLKHYSYMVDLLGRVGLLKEAVVLIESMPMDADAGVLGPLFAACRVHKNILLGEKVGLELLKLDPHDSGNYVLLANMYGEANMWEEADKVRRLMWKVGVQKTPGCSSIEVNGIVCEFIVRDKSHPQSNRIYECLSMLKRHLDLVNHVSNVPNLEDEFIVGSGLASVL